MTDNKNLITLPSSMITADQLMALEKATTMLPFELECLSPILDSILASYRNIVPPHKRPIKTRAATDIGGVIDAADLVNVDWQNDSSSHILKHKTPAIPPELDTNYAGVIADLKRNVVIRHRNDEAMTRTVIDLILVDRLNHLANEEAYEKLLPSAEVPVSIMTVDDNEKPLLIKGRADWVLGWGKNRRNTGSLLVVVEAKAMGGARSGLPQLLIYMAAIQEARKYRPNKTVFGMLSDGSEFIFACMTKEKKFLVSDPLMWNSSQKAILAQIDSFLLDAIHSSPHTTPAKVRNTILHRYPKYLKESWKFGVETDDEDEGGEVESSDDEDYVDVIRKGGSISLRSAER